MMMLLLVVVCCCCGCRVVSSSPPRSRSLRLRWATLYTSSLLDSV